MSIVENSLIIRASAVMAAAGAYDTNPTEIDCSQADQADFWLSYDQHVSASAGQVTVKIETAITVGGTDYWSYARYVVLTGTFAQGSTVDSQVQAETLEFDPTAATAEYIHLMVDSLNADKIRINVKESGETSYPGTVAIYCRLK